jgi:hypothetical protein
MAKKYSKRGLSVIVTTLLVIVLSMAAVAVVWISVNSIVKKQMESSVSCYGNYDKIKINGMYTCFNKTSATNYNLRFSLFIGDVTVNKVIVSIYSGSAVNSYTITNTPQSISGLTMYPSGISQINLSSKNSGLSYEATGFGYPIDSIQIAPYIGKNLCGVSDSLSSIEDCQLIS